MHLASPGSGPAATWRPKESCARAIGRGTALSAGLWPGFEVPLGSEGPRHEKARPGPAWPPRGGPHLWPQALWGPCLASPDSEPGLSQDLGQRGGFPELGLSPLPCPCGAGQASGREAGGRPWPLPLRGGAWGQAQVQVPQGADATPTTFSPAGQSKSLWTPAASLVDWRRGGAFSLPDMGTGPRSRLALPGT